MEIAETFAKFVVHTEFNDMDESVIDYVKKLTLKQVMGMLVGSVAPTSKKFIRYAKEPLTILASADKVQRERCCVGEAQGGRRWSQLV